MLIHKVRPPSRAASRMVTRVLYFSPSHDSFMAYSPTSASSISSINKSYGKHDCCVDFSNFIKILGGH